MHQEGQRRREYVDVIVRVARSGSEQPRAIIMGNGRTYTIDRTTYRKALAGGTRYTIHIGGHVTYLYKDETANAGPRWYVELREGQAGGALPARHTAAGPGNGPTRQNPIAR